MKRVFPSIFDVTLSYSPDVKRVENEVIPYPATAAETVDNSEPDHFDPLSDYLLPKCVNLGRRPP